MGVLVVFNGFQRYSGLRHERFVTNDRCIVFIWFLYSGILILLNTIKHLQKRMIECVCVTLRYINIRRQCHIPASYSIKHCQCVISYYLYNVSPSRKMKGWTLFIQIYPQGIDVQATLRPLIQKELFLQILSLREEDFCNKHFLWWRKCL